VANGGGVDPSAPAGDGPATTTRIVIDSSTASGGTIAADGSPAYGGRSGVTIGAVVATANSGINDTGVSTFSAAEVPDTGTRITSGLDSVSGNGIGGSTNGVASGSIGTGSTGLDTAGMSPTNGRAYPMVTAITVNGVVCYVGNCP
jgi:hypothetical protein